MKTLFIPALAASMAFAAAGCGPKTEKAIDKAANQTSDVAADAGNAMANAVDAVLPAPGTQDFVDKAIRSDAFEIAASQLAQDHAASPKVKQFAREMISAHGQSTTEIKAGIARGKEAITPNATLTSDQQGRLDDLAKLKGAEFDRQYLSDQVDAHEDALSLLNDYAKRGENAPLKSTAGKLAPTVQKHLERAKALQPH